MSVTIVIARGGSPSIVSKNLLRAVA